MMWVSTDTMWPWGQYWHHVTTTTTTTEWGQSWEETYTSGNKTHVGWLDSGQWTVDTGWAPLEGILTGTRLQEVEWKHCWIKSPPPPSPLYVQLEVEISDQSHQIVLTQKDGGGWGGNTGGQKTLKDTYAFLMSSCVAPLGTPSIW